MPYPPINTKVWSCVGSAGVVDVADIGKVDFVRSVVKLHGIELVNASLISNVAERPSAPAAVGSVQTQAVIRYGITPNLFSSGVFYTLNLFGRSGNGQIGAKLIWVVRPNLNTPVALKEVPMVTAGIGFGNPNRFSFVLQQGDASFGGGDLVDNATYYIEVTLSANSRLEAILINPPELAVVEVVVAAP